MNPNEDHAKKSRNSKRDSILADTITNAEKSKAKNPRGVELPLEEDMTPPQFG